MFVFYFFKILSGSFCSQNCDRQQAVDRYRPGTEASSRERGHVPQGSGLSKPQTQPCTHIQHSRLTLVHPSSYTSAFLQCNICIIVHYRLLDVIIGLVELSLNLYLYHLMLLKLCFRFTQEIPALGINAH